MSPRWRIRRQAAATVEVTGDRVLVTGWFSWPNMGTTAGDLLARDVATGWAREAGREVDVANAPGFGAAFRWDRADPALYSDVLFVCGPVGPADAALRELQERFRGSRHIGIDVTMLRPLDEWNGFDLLLERDSERTARPDISLGAAQDHVPVIGVVLVEPYPPEYPDRDRQTEARAAVAKLVASRPCARVPIDTRLAPNEGGLRSPAEVEALLARMDAVVTTRLHGLVLSLRNGVPVVAIDLVAGGAKITKQAEVLGWPAIRNADDVAAEDLEELLDWCLTPEARELARECAAAGRRQVEEVGRQVVEVLRR